MGMNDDIPAGFEPETDDGRFFDMIGPVYARRDTPEAAPIFAFRAGRKHTNQRDVVQGGMLVTLGDHTLAIACWTAAQGPCATISLNTDFLGPAREGDWVEARGEVTKMTRSLVFGKSYVYANGNLILTATGVWKRLGKD